MSFLKSRPKDERLLMATLGEYTLPPKTLVLLLEKPPMEPNFDLPLPNPCWLGRSALGMNMNERSTAGNMYRGALSGSEMRTGLSRRSGGRWSGSFVYCRTNVLPYVTASFMPGICMRTTT